MGKSLGIAWLGAVTLTGAICPKAGIHKSGPLGKIKLFTSPFFRDSPSQGDGNTSFRDSGSQCRGDGGLGWGWGVKM